MAEAQIVRLRSGPAAVSRYVARKPGHSLGPYWQAVPYLITGQVTNAEPLRWFTEGGEILGRNEAGEVRYLRA